MNRPVPDQPEIRGDVLIPAGVPIGEAATWVGHACWAELRFHEVLTSWLAVETDGASSQRWWTIRAHRSDLAESWHRRLPELREFPRPGWVGPSGDVAADAFTQADLVTDPAATADRRVQAARILAGLADGYRRRADVARGPADGPTSASLARAVETTDNDLALLGADPIEAVPVILL